MHELDIIAEEIRLDFEARTAARDRALSQARTSPGTALTPFARFTGKNASWQRRT